MSPLANKMKHGNLSGLPYQIIRSKDPPAEQRPLPHANPLAKGKRSFPSYRQGIYLIHLSHPEESKTIKTAWEYYNEGTSAAASRHIL